MNDLIRPSRSSVGLRGSTYSQEIPTAIALLRYLSAPKGAETGRRKRIEGRSLDRELEEFGVRPRRETWRQGVKVERLGTMINDPFCFQFVWNKHSKNNLFMHGWEPSFQTIFTLLEQGKGNVILWTYKRHTWSYFFYHIKIGVTTLFCSIITVCCFQNDYISCIRILLFIHSCKCMMDSLTQPIFNNLQLFDHSPTWCLSNFSICPRL